MKTVFKKGMKVYDQVFFGDETLEIIEVRGDMSLRVLYGEAIYCYTGDGRFIGDDIISNRWNCISQIPTLSTSPYTFQGFEQKAPAPTYEEAEEWIRREYEKGNNYLMLKDTFEALRKLTILREYYNNGWQPDWSKDNWKYFISIRRVHPIVEFEIDCSAGIPHVLSFKTRDIAEKFLEEQRELLEIAKPLL